jgi:hypothetical protein
MIPGFPLLQDNIEKGVKVGVKPLPYEQADIHKIDKALEIANYGWQPVSENLPKAGTKEERAEAAAIYKAFIETERACEPYSMSNAEKYFAEWKAEALASGKPGDAPTNKNEVKDRMRHVTRAKRAEFRAKYFARYYTVTHSMLNAVIPELTKLAEAENKKDAANLAKYGITQTHPNPIVCGLLSVRRYFVQQLVAAENALENAAALMNLHVDSDLLRALGCDLK